MAVAPTVHLNGTSKQALLDAYCDAIDKLHEAGHALAQAAPNGRDYYTQAPIEGVPAFTLAQTQHESRMNKLRAIIGELEQIGEAVSDQG